MPQKYLIIDRTNSNELYHHGIKGQKWGVRRYQNEDGSLTSAGQARYNGKKDYSSKDGGVIRDLAKSSFSGRKTASDWAERKLGEKGQEARRNAEQARRDAADLLKNNPNNVASARSLQKYADKQDARAEKYEKYQQAQSAANANRKAYEDHTSTGKLVVQDFLLSKYGAQNYRAARARGEGRVRSFFESTAGITPIATILAAKGNKKAYGSHIVLSAI